MENEIVIKDIKAIKVASISHQGLLDDMEKHINQLYKTCQGKICGPLIILLYEFISEQRVNVEVCLPIDKEVISNLVDIKYLPEVKVVATTHQGSYDKLHNVYEKLTAYAYDHSYKIVKPAREIYLVGPNHDNSRPESDFITDVYLPIIAK